MKKILTALFLASLMVTTGCGNQAKQQVEQKVEEAKPAFDEAVKPATDAANAAVDTANQAATDAANAATDAANAAVDTANQAATDAANAANQAATDAANVATDAANAAVDAAKDLLPSVEVPDIISSTPSIGATREMFEYYDDGQYVATYDDNGRVISMTINTPYIDNDLLASILPSDVQITSFDTNSSDSTKTVNHFQGTSEQLKLINPKSGGKFEAFTNFDRQTSEFLGGTISIINP